MNKKTKIFGLAASVLTSAVFSAESASAQVDQKPYILFVMDTSGSTEWTTAGDERYPNLAATPPDLPEWVPGTPMQLGSGPSGNVIPGQNVAGPARFGPCFVWEPNSCGSYGRPPWTFRYTAWQDVFSSQALMTTRAELMKGTYLPVGTVGAVQHNGIRLSDESQPRHVTLKEVLTGDMLLKADLDPREPHSLSAVLDGPGCWFVPRQRNASVQGPEDSSYCAGESKFEELPDHDEPRPHFQEVFDAQKNNGVLDRLSSEAIFGVAMLDGYRDDVNNWPKKLNDSVDGSSGIDGSPSSTDTYGNDEESSTNYNLGVYRIVGPKRLDLPPQFLDQLSSHVQQTIIEAGYLRRQNAGEIDVKDGVPELGLAYDKDAKKYIEDGYEMAKHPIARATPLAAAVMDIHQFLANDDRFKKGDKHSKDPYAECRPKQVVLISDGYPEPEKPGGFSGSNIGSEALTPAFGYNENLYPYLATENEIAALTSNSALYNASNSDAARRYGPRVHVVALSVETDATTKAEMLLKLSSMAKHGKTCAQAFLPDHVPAATDPTGALGHCVAGCTQPPVGGVCLPGTSKCFAGPQTSYEYHSTGVTDTPLDCKYPALILNSNDREAMEQAIFSVTSGIIGGSETITRTRAAISNFLDDNAYTAGGQYRTFSGVQTLGSYWRGILNREVIPCDDSGTVNFANTLPGDEETTAGITSSNVAVRPLHADIGDQVNCGIGAGGECATIPPTDNRRIFTSLPKNDIYNYGSASGIPLDRGGRMHFLWDPVLIAPSAEEFRDSSFPHIASPASLSVGSRIPLRAEQLKEGLAAATGGSWTDQNVADFMNANNYADLEGVVRNHRGQIPSKGTNDRATSRVFSGVLNSDPVVVPPPILDLPIESYRAFRAFYGDRPTMLYSATVDGQLHAIHLGDLKNQISVRTATADNTWSEAVSTTLGAEVTQAARGQREAWSYVPNTLLRQLADNTRSQGYLMDGATVVRDVRLCQSDAGLNQNNQACRAIRTTGTLTQDQQWRTVLVQALGRAGGGYFAMDVTRTGGLRPGAASRTIDKPDPVLLWEFDREWESAQVQALAARDPELVIPPNTLTGQYSNPSGICGTNSAADVEAFWNNAAMGLSISAPEIATLAVDMGSTIEQRPVAVFAAGAADENVDGCAANLQGSAIYVIDLQTGSLLRRFVTYFDGTEEQTFAKNKDAAFETRFGRIQLTGSPALYDSATGALASRGFVGDSIGRLYRMNFKDPDPANWKVDLFFDPYASTDLQSAADAEVGSGSNFGPAAYKPAISRGPNRQLVVTYGLGDTSDSPTPELAQAVITIAETDGTIPFELRWYTVLAKGEKLMGEPLVFNGAAYFSTYWVPNADVCQPGHSRIWGVDYFASSGLNAPQGVYDISDPDFVGGDTILSPGATATNPAVWFSPSGSTLIRGLALTLGPVCSVRGLNDDTQATTGTEGMDTQPQLIAQTSAPANRMGTRLNNDSSPDAIGRLTKNLKRPRSMTIPLSWSVIQ